MMLRSEWLVLTLTLAVLAQGGTSRADEEKTKFEDLPKAVKATVKKLYPDAKIVGASKETDDDEDETIYEVELKVDGKSVELAIDDDGEVEAIEKEIDVDDLPKAVIRAAVQRFPNGKITKVEEVTDEEEKVVYELAVTNDGEKIEAVMSPNGKILAIEEEDDDEEKGDKKKDKDDDDKKDKDGKKKDKDDDDKKDKDGKKKDKDDDDKKDKDGKQKDDDDKKDKDGKKKDKDA